MSTSVIDPAACLKALVACPSVTPADGGALPYLDDVLNGLGFTTERLVFSEPGTPDVENLFARIGDGAPHLVFSGHTDVVPPGDEHLWQHPPFAADVADGVLYGRGAVDMKGGIAAFVAAASRFLDDGGTPPGTLSLLITGDEEGPSINGTVKLLDWALNQGNRFDAALVGEPTSRARLGDTIKIGRRGSLSGTVRVAGRQGHVAYPHHADNPVPVLIKLVNRLATIELDEGSEDFQPSNLEVTSVDVGNPAFNVIPAEATARFNVRFNDRWTADSLRDRIHHELADAAGGRDFTLDIVRPVSACFLTGPGPLTSALTAAIEAETAVTPDLSTGGGTSDARHFKAVCPVAEFGLVGTTMHQIDERVPLAELSALTSIYEGFLRRFFGAAGDA
ncbi:succinyl-diaminopimelate desuccinylase [Bauldia sp.]|uniref:succinyl-diaminopimelate desuccinylase n=1 Tax=Bauldia sp. TaxID=2575872 RepID=UPI003BA86B07